jgi:leucyl aminopeptidase
MKGVAMLEITFAKPVLPEGGVLVVPVGEGLELSGLAMALDEALGGGLKRALEAAGFKGKAGSSATLLAPGAYKRVLALGAGKPGEARGAETLGGAVSAALGKEEAVSVLADGLNAEEAAALALGLRLRAYRFDKYRTTLKDDEKPKLAKVTVLTSAPKEAAAAYERLSAVAKGVELTRDLVTEPANVLFPAEFAERCEKLKKLGVKVEVLGQTELDELGFGTLLAVSQGSAREPKMVVMQWLGDPAHEDKKAKKPVAPIALIGKGVCFDSGGISIKPAAGMEDMKWDMAGAGAVTGAMAALAGRKAKLDVVGLIGLVENMPSGAATRPGDVVKSYSGQTVEILNTDAEGRLVLADVLHYANTRFAPRLMVDLATLTGAIIVGLGHEYAGLFANDDELATKLAQAGEAVGEKLWRMPLVKKGQSYDKELNSPIADVKNIGGGRAGGSITAAQFLQRFVGETKWAHLDIAGVAWAGKDSATAPKGATGFGVRLLDEFVKGFEG